LVFDDVILIEFIEKPNVKLIFLKPKELYIVTALLAFLELFEFHVFQDFVRLLKPRLKQIVFGLLFSCIRFFFKVSFFILRIFEVIPKNTRLLVARVNGVYAKVVPKSQAIQRNVDNVYPNEDRPNGSVGFKGLKEEHEAISDEHQSALVHDLKPIVSF